MKEWCRCDINSNKSLLVLLNVTFCSDINSPWRSGAGVDFHFEDEHTLLSSASILVVDMEERVRYVVEACRYMQTDELGSQMIKAERKPSSGGKPSFFPSLRSLYSGRFHLTLFFLAILVPFRHWNFSVRLFFSCNFIEVIALRYNSELTPYISLLWYLLFYRNCTHS